MSRVRDALEGLEWTGDVKVNFDEKTAFVSVSGDDAGGDALVAALEGAGFAGTISREPQSE